MRGGASCDKSYNSQCVVEPNSLIVQPDLSDLKAFAAVAARRSFRAAAVELGVSPSAVSHAIRRLEERLGIRLLNRTSRSVAATEAGERLLLRLQPALHNIAGALEAVNGFRDTPMGTVRLNMPRSAAPLLLAPLAARYLRAYPQMRLEITTDDRLIDIVSGGFDAGIRFGERLERDMVALPIGPPRRFAVVGAPGYLRKHGKPAVPRDLRAHACIRFRFPGGALYRWEFEKGGQALDVEVDGPLTVDGQDLMVQAALDGVGLAFTFEDYVLPHLRRRRLVRVLEDWCPRFPGFFLYYPSRRQPSAGLRAFIDLVRRERMATA